MLINNPSPIDTFSEWQEVIPISTWTTSEGVFNPLKWRTNGKIIHLRGCIFKPGAVVLNTSAFQIPLTLVASFVLATRTFSSINNTRIAYCFAVNPLGFFIPKQALGSSDNWFFFENLLMID